jgi:hypothetical protein
LSKKSQALEKAAF